MRFTRITLLAALIPLGFWTGCRHAPPRPAVAALPQIVIKPERPQCGVPINPAGLYQYLYQESTNLLAQGKLNTNLTQNLDRRSCRLTVQAAPDRQLSPAELMGEVENGVAVVAKLYICSKCHHVHFVHGTGFFLTDTGALGTCRHLITHSPGERTISLVAMTRDGRVCPVREVLASDDTNDVAILQVEGEGFKPVPVAPGAPAGTPVCVVSHPEFWYYYLSTGIVCGDYKVRLDLGGITHMTISADFGQGSSGAPVFNPAGAVVGLACSTRSTYSDKDGAPNRSQQMVEKFCIPSAALLRLIRPE